MIPTEPEAFETTGPTGTRRRTGRRGSPGAWFCSTGTVGVFTGPPRPSSRPSTGPGPVGYGPLYPSVWIVEEPGRGWWVTLAWDGLDEIQELVPTSRHARALADLWRQDLAEHRAPSCPACRGEGDVPCPDCDGIGWATLTMTWHADEILGDCPRRVRCERCLGSGEHQGS